MPVLKLDANELTTVCNFVKDSCGVFLDETKDYLIESRLSEVCDKHDCDSYFSLIDKAKTQQTLQSQIVDAMTTNETLFFRDDASFQALQHKAIPELLDAKDGTLHSNRLRIWSAACSTGQEAYSIAITLCNLLPDIDAWDVQIHGSDVSAAALEQAREGLYSSIEIERGLPADYLRKYFVQTDEGWRVIDQLRSMCSFDQRDLTKPIIGAGPFDIVFCRNVAIYFTPEDRQQLFERIIRIMNPAGYLFVGASENLSDVGLKPHQHCNTVFYRPGTPPSFV